VEVVVTLIYWPLMLFLPAALMQSFESEASSDVPQFYRIPLSLDLSLHAAPALALLADFTFFEAKYGKNATRYGAPVASLVFAVWYASCAEYFASFNGSFPYPFLTENTFPVRVAIYSGATTLALLSFWGMNGIKAS
jgi:hypothetical protein